VSVPDLTHLAAREGGSFPADQAGLGAGISRRHTEAKTCSRVDRSSGVFTFACTIRHPVL